MTRHLSEVHSAAKLSPKKFSDHRPLSRVAGASRVTDRSPGAGYVNPAVAVGASES
jgi:hypothetical protein